MPNNTATTVFTDFDKFADAVGLIESPELLEAAGAPQGFDERGAYDTDRLDDLREFCRKNPKFHIVTVTSESDDAEDIEYRRLFPDWQKFSDEKRARLRELIPVSAVTAANCVRVVNRLDYFLASGAADSFITVSDATGYQKEFSELFWVCNCESKPENNSFIQPYKIKVCTRCQTPRPLARE